MGFDFRGFVTPPRQVRGRILNWNVGLEGVFFELGTRSRIFILLCTTRNSLFRLRRSLRCIYSRTASPGILWRRGGECLFLPEMTFFCSWRARRYLRRIPDSLPSRTTRGKIFSFLTKKKHRFFQCQRVKLLSRVTGKGVIISARASTGRKVLRNIGRAFDEEDTLL